jgi:hypothetical protein
MREQQQGARGFLPVVHTKKPAAMQPVRCSRRLTQTWQAVGGAPVESPVTGHVSDDDLRTDLDDSVWRKLEVSGGVISTVGEPYEELLLPASHL